MGHTIDYSGLSDEEKHNKAIEDVKFYLGDRYEFVLDILREAQARYFANNGGGHIPVDHLSFLLAFVGIAGYPVYALWEMLRDEQENAFSEEPT